MICERPYTKDGLALACGQCQPCRIQRRKVWSHRIMLEASQHASNAFVTLTYDDAHLPKNGCVSVRDMQLFIKRLRKQGHKFRYYCVGEYGDQSYRPHYHLALFGFPQCYRGQTDLRKSVCCPTCSSVKRAWQDNGAIQVAFLEPASASYIAGYVTKKIKGLGQSLPKGLTPEFQRVSLRPGLGLRVMHDVADRLLTYNLEKEIEDVPMSLQHGKFKLPLGRYLRCKLRRMIGRDEKCPPQVLEKVKAELLPLRQQAFNASSSFAEAVVQANKGKRANVLARAKIKQPRKSL